MLTSGHRTILHVTPYYPPHLGGVERVTRDLAEALAERHSVEVLTTTCGAGGEPRMVRAGNLTVRRHRAIELLHTPVSPGLLVRVLCAPRDAVVHVHTAMPLTPEIVWLASALRHRPFIAHFHGVGYPGSVFGRWIFLVYMRTVLSRTLRAASKVIVLNDEQAQWLAGHFRVNPDAITVLPNAAGPQFRHAPRTEHPRTGACRLLYVGRIHPVKAVPRLVRAVALMREPVDAVIVGDGADFPKVERLVRDLHLENVRLVGVQRGDDLLRWYRWADVFVLPSDKEGMPLAMLEAMAVGLPVVATDVPGSRETLGEAGVLSAPDPQSLATVLDKVASDEQLRGTLAARSLIRAEEYSWPRLIERLERVYAQVRP